MSALTEMQQALEELEAVVIIQTWTDPNKLRQVAALKYAVAFLQLCKLRNIDPEEFTAAIKRKAEAAT